MIKEDIFDVIIENGTVIDGTGKEPIKSDIGVINGKIKSIGNLCTASAKVKIDASGQYVCPGFIDAHNHTDTYSRAFPGAEGKILQGVTTDICGLCGGSAAPIGAGCIDEYVNRNKNLLPQFVFNPIYPISFSEYIEEVGKRGNSTNMAMFVGNSNLRIHAIGYENRKASHEELEVMKKMLSQAMESGAFGLSTGLTYVPSMFASTDELIELCKAMVPYGGIYNSHMRNEGNSVIESVKEVIEIAERSGCHGHISHLKVMGRNNHGKSHECLKLIEEANREGINITFDVYPYTAGSCGLGTLLPDWVLSIGFEDDFAALIDNRDRIIKDMEKDDWDNISLSCGYNNIFIGNAGEFSQYEGKSIAQIAKENGISEIDAVFKVLADSKGQATMIYHALSEDDLIEFMKSPYCMIGTDAYARHYEGPSAAGKPHPRNYGGFPRYISRYVLNDSILNLEEGIYKITGLPAKTFNIAGRGEIKAGYIADITVFDPESITDTGDYETPNKKPKGVNWVLIDGQIVVKNGEFLDLRKGRMIKHI